MENMNNEVLTEEMEEITDVVKSNGNGLKILKTAGIGAISIIGWELLKPVAKKIKNKFLAWKAARKTKKESEMDLEDMELDDIPEIEE